MKPAYRMPGPLRKIVYLIVFLLLVLTLAALHVEPTVLAIVAVGALVMLFSLERKSAEYTPASVMQRAATLFLAAGGYVIGLVLPVKDMNFLPDGLGLALLVWFVVGWVELKILGKILSAHSAVSILDRHRFPFFALGVALSIVLRSH